MLDEKYGVTPTGFSRKRLDEIIDEIHDDLSEGFGFNTKANPKSFLGVLVTNFADKIAELWEVGEQNYNSQAPSTAEGISLERCGQLGGSFRKDSTPSYYTILCTGDNGTIIPEGSVRIRTDTNPAVELSNPEKGAISTHYCVAAEIRSVGSYSPEDKFSISVDGHKYEVSLLDGESPIEALEAELMKERENDSFDIRGYVSVKTEAIGSDEVKTAIVLTFEESVPHTVLISSNLDASSVTSLVQFATVESGDFALPKNSTTVITTGVSGLKKVTNLADYIKGRSLETDSEFRKSYIEKIYIRSRTMLESIKAAILANCNGVESVAGFENDTNEWDFNGCCRAPHSVEMVVIGGDKKEIAEQIFATKAAGINTSHCDGIVKGENGDYAIEETVEDDYGNPVVVRFSRPVPILFHIDVTVDAAKNETVALNAETLVKEIIMNNINSLNPGDDLVPQQFLSELYQKVPGFLNYRFSITQEKGNDYVGVSSVQGIGYNKVARCEDINDVVVHYGN